ncbi:COX assembly mitochondrial 2 -like protein [Brachionus plicatilis]|uniref:COX assembly mitochondrial protein n=1 Tax=Brachionus plicatilis TaxID=10195 RepID=A0A3M7QFU7_BRAPC|nr:COX assembly mitochondrial 2 -like protein [Brachionus plicatilis]
MHSSLAKHLHSDECVRWIEAYEQCNKEKYLGVCSDLQNKMAGCMQRELRNRRNIGAENVKKRELDNYAKHNPEFAAKLKLLDDLKAQKEHNNSKENLYTSFQWNSLTIYLINPFPRNTLSKAFDLCREI